jgi:hypothetical protein
MKENKKIALIFVITLFSVLLVFLTPVMSVRFELNLFCMTFNICCFVYAFFKFRSGK